MKTLVLWARRVLILGIVCVMIIYGVGFFMEAPQIGQGHYIKMYDDQGALFYQSDEQSNDVSLNEISEDFLVAIVSIEDHRFYSHLGFDIVGISRAVVKNLVASKSQGASTISQQYARLLFLTNDKTWERKIKEAFLTIRLETHYDKDTILQGYVNTVFFGHGIYGIKNASQYYFNKKPSELDLNEATMLAGVINGPSYYSPYIDLVAAKERQKLVLDRLVEDEYITEEKSLEIQNTEFVLNENPTSASKNQHPYYKDTVIQELTDLGFYEENYINQGLNIYTTMDSDTQNELEATVSDNMNDKGELEISSMVVSNDDAGVMALVGGKDYALSQFNRATDAQRQIASTIKPLLYYVALENGFTPNTKFLSAPTEFTLESGQTYAPTNFSDRYANTEITLAQAIALSDNIYAVKTHLFLGEQALVNALNKFGYTHVSPHPSLALGTLNTNIYEVANIYTTFANQGINREIHTITKITNHNNEVLYQRENNDVALLDRDTCLILSQLLTSTFKSEYHTYSNPTMSNYQTNTTFACKTGTSDFDSLCIGYNPNYTLLSWVGFDDNRDLTITQDKMVPKVVFQHMANYLQTEEEWYSPTATLQSIPVDPLTGDFSESGLVYWFKSR